MQMKTNLKYFAIMALLLGINFQQSYAQPIEREQAFFVFMKVYDLTPSTPTEVSKRRGSLPQESPRISKSKGGYQLFKDHGENFLEYYLYVFDPYNFEQKRNDEFERNKYAAKMNAKILKGINDVRFEKKYTISGRADIGEYSGSENSFPIRFDPHAAFALPFYSENLLECYCEILNYANFNMALKMSEAQAKTFIAKRKNPNGAIDRRVSLNLTYSVVNKKTANPTNSASNIIGSGILIYVYSIDILDYEGATKKLGTLYPDLDYYDKVHGIKIKDGTETTYSNAGWRTCSKEEAKYYRVVNYVDGKLSGPVKDYYISGQLQMEGTYTGYWAEPGYGNGPFIYYYENGQKSMEVAYVSGKQNGIFTSWYSNGVKKEEVNMIDGAKDGCDYKWSEDGKQDPRGYPLGYFEFYQNGQLVGRSFQCPSDSRKK